ncbi:MAG: Cell wall assembly/cell proliferation coordinating protein [Planctomycetaceae bacterium]|nr:Cell wall assembly/cell proliferation coordinating protein [Planctomycetaceae bacterium]
MLESLFLTLYCVLIIGTAFLFLKIRERLRTRREQRDYETLKREHPERVYGTPEYEARFSHPDFAAIESQLGRPVPDAYRSLYSDSQIVRTIDLEVVPPDSKSPEDYWPIICFFPADGQSIVDLWPGKLLTSSQLPFATDGSGGLYYLELLDQNENDPPVFFYHWDGEIREKITDSLNEFLTWRRVATADSEQVVSR